MDKNIPIVIKKVANGFQVRPDFINPDSEAAEDRSIHVFYTLDHMHTFLRNHFKENELNVGEILQKSERVIAAAEKRILERTS